MAITTVRFAWVGAVAAGLLLLGVGYLLGTHGPAVRVALQSATVSTWSLVSVDTNTVYVGRLIAEDDRYLHLADAYLLQPNPAADEDSEAPAYLLNRIADNELYATVGPIRISREHAVSVERLADSSELVTGLKEDRATK